jgi:hypothetical protein
MPGLNDHKQKSSEPDMSNSKVQALPNNDIADAVIVTPGGQSHNRNRVFLAKDLLFSFQSSAMVSTQDGRSIDGKASNRA